MVRVATPRSLLAAIARRWPAFGGERPPDRAALQQMVDVARVPWVLVAPTEARDGYEAAIAEHRIPTRDGSWHDAFNVLAFVQWPRAKPALHARVLACQRGRARSGPRSREEDALALLDETAIVVGGPAELVERFDAARREGTIDEMSAAVAAGLDVRCFGHALLEHLALERPPIGAGLWTIATDDCDAALADAVAAGTFAAPCFAPTVPWPHPSVLTWLRMRAC